jgi:dihydrofolate reductase
MAVTIVVARSLNNVIGDAGKIPWHVKGEQKRFAEITRGGVLVMGRKTFESIGRPLPGRQTIIVTRNDDYTAAGCDTAPSLDSALAMASRTGKSVFIVGGGEIYVEALNFVDGVHISTIQVNVAGDTLFPPFPTGAFRLVNEQYVDSNIPYVYQYFERTTGANK